LRGLAATYTEHGSITSEKPENSSKSGARNRHYLLFRAEGLSVHSSPDITD